jgi:hypothetical protein
MALAGWLLQVAVNSDKAQRARSDSESKNACRTSPGMRLPHASYVLVKVLVYEETKFVPVMGARGGGGWGQGSGRWPRAVVTR